LRKVLGIVFFQMVFTLSMALYSSFNDSFASIVRNPATLISAVLLLFLSMTTLLCCDLTRAVPANYFLLFLFTLSQSVLVSVTASMYKPESVILAIVILVIVTTCLWFGSLCMTSSEDYARNMLLAIAIGCIIQMAAFPFYFAGRAFDTYLMIEGLGGSLIYGAYVAIDLHLIAEKIDIDDYILGAITLYVDLITLFIKILQVVGKRK
jgi:protein lifeguard